VYHSPFAVVREECSQPKKIKIQRIPVKKPERWPEPAAARMTCFSATTLGSSICPFAYRKSLPDPLLLLCIGGGGKGEPFMEMALVSCVGGGKDTSYKESV